MRYPTQVFDLLALDTCLNGILGLGLQPLMGADGHEFKKLTLPKKSELPKILGGAAAPLAPPACTPMQRPKLIIDCT